MRLSRTSGVSPIVSRMESRMSVPASVSRVLMWLRVCAGRADHAAAAWAASAPTTAAANAIAMPAGWTSAATSAQNTTKAAMPVTIPRSRSCSAARRAGRA